MKVRLGFVSNSSSSSFVLDKDGMTDDQLEAFREVIRKSEELIDETRIYESAHHFHGELSMHDELIPLFLKMHSLEADIEM